MDDIYCPFYFIVAVTCNYYCEILLIGQLGVMKNFWVVHFTNRTAEFFITLIQHIGATHDFEF